MAQPVVQFETRRGANGKRVGFATLNAERSLNALSAAVIKALSEQLHAWRDDPTIACVVLQGAGDKAFCAGGDIVDLYQLLTRADWPAVERYFVQEYTLDYFVHGFSKPVLCWGHGIVMGGGLGLLVGASHRIVTDSSRVATPEIAIGLYPDVAASWFLARMPVRTGLFIGLTGVHLNAADALFVSLADYYLPSSEQVRLYERLLALPWSDSARVNHYTLSALLRAYRGEYAPPASNVRARFDIINEVTDRDTVEEILEALEARAEGDAWLARAAQGLRAGSPTSAKVILEIRRRTSRLSLKEIFALELGLTMQFARHPDLREGVRARVIDKDNQPHWSPPTLAQVSDSYVEEHFASPWPPGRHPFRDW